MKTEFKFIWDDEKYNDTNVFLKEIAYQLKRIADKNDKIKNGGEK